MLHLLNQVSKQNEQLTKKTESKILIIIGKKYFIELRNSSCDYVIFSTHFFAYK